MGNVGAQPLGMSASGGTSAPTAPMAPTAPAQNINIPNNASSDINKGYNDYFAQLDAMASNLGGTKTAQEQAAQSQYQSGLGEIGTQKAQATQQLQTTQVKTLKDLADAMRTQMEAGQTYLGGLGAGDSSAAGQYSYALNKLGSKQRGDLMTNVNNQMQNIQTVYDQETNRLKAENDARIAQIATWFTDAQNQIAQLRGQGALGQGQNLAQISQNATNFAISQLQQAQQQVASRKSMLEQWAMNNSTNAQQLQNNFSTINANPQLAGGMNTTPFYPGSNAQDLTKLQNPGWMQ